MAASTVLPSPQAFLDPLTIIDNCYFYAVPKYWPANHANTRWFAAMIRNNRLDKIKRKMELHPKMFRSTLFQLLDDPKLHSPDDPSANSLFHKKAVLYLSTLGLAMYFKNAGMVQIMLQHRDTTGEEVCSLNEPQYATHIQDPVEGDFHAYPIAIVMLRLGCYDYVNDMLAAGWNPLESICMPIRRRFERRALYYLDWLDYILNLLHERPMLQLARLVQSITSDPRLYKYQRLPLSTIRPRTEDDRIRTGIVIVEQLPLETKMIGVKSLLDIAIDYDVYLQSKERYAMIRDCYKEMIGYGVDPEIMLAQAQDYDAAPDYKPSNSGPRSKAADAAAATDKAADSSATDKAADTSEETVLTVGGNNASRQSNNAAASASSKKGAKGKIGGAAYLSEPTRILLHALNTNSKGSNKTPLLPLLDAVAVYFRRNFFLIYSPLSSGGKKTSAGDKQTEQEFIFQLRDVRNTIVILLNLMQQQYEKIEKIQKSMKEKAQGKFKHIDPSKQANNKLIMLTRNLKVLANLLFQTLLHSRELVSFVESAYPPYTWNEGGNVDFALNPALKYRLKGIQMGLMADFSVCKTAMNYMTVSQIKRAVNIKEMTFNMRVGKEPTKDEIAESGKGQSKGKGKSNKGGKTGNSSNVNENAIDLSQPRTVRWNDSADALQFLFNGEEVPRPKSHAGHVTFVKVKRKATPSYALTNRQLKDGDRPIEDVELVAAKSTDDYAPRDIGADVVARLTGQINQLRQSSDEADVALAGIYQRILNDLMARAEAATKAVAANSDSGASDETSDEGKDEDQPVISEKSEESPDQSLEASNPTTEEDDGDGDDGGGDRGSNGGVENNDVGAAEEVSEEISGSSRCRVNKKRRCGHGKRSRRCWRPAVGGGGGSFGGGGGSVGGGAGHRKGQYNRASGVVSYQKARVFDAPPGGTEFDLLNSSG